MTEKKMGWPQQRFFEFRAGHGTYLAFAVSLVTFVLIVHRLLIEKVPELNAVFGDLLTFTLTFAILYVPIAVLVGRWHLRLQKARLCAYYCGRLVNGCCLKYLKK